MADKRFECTYTVQDLIDAQRLNWARAMMGFKILRRFAVVGTALGIFYALITYLAGGDLNERILAALGGVVVVFVIILAFAVFSRLFLIPRHQRKSFSQMKEYSGQNSFTIQDNDLLITTSRGHTTLPYSDFVKWNENEKVLALYRTDRLMHFIPKKEAPAEFISTLRSKLTAANVPAAAFWNS